VVAKLFRHYTVVTLHTMNFTFGPRFCVVGGHTTRVKANGRLPPTGGALHCLCPRRGGGAPRTLVTPLSCEPALAHLDWWCDGRVCQTTASRREEPHCVSCVTCGRRKPTCVCRTRPALLLTVFLPATSSADSSILQHVHNQSLAPPCTSKPSKFFTRRLQQRRRNDFNFQHCGGEHFMRVGLCIMH